LDILLISLPLLGNGKSGQIRFQPEMGHLMKINEIFKVAQDYRISNSMERIYFSNLNVIERVQQEPLGNIIRFVFISDSAGYKEYRRLLPQIEKLEKKPMVVFHGGDFASKGSIHHYKKHLQITLKSPFNIIHIPGNHDLTHRGRQLFKRIFGKTFFSFTYQNVVKFIIINNADRKIGYYGIDQQQLEWLKNELKDENPRIKIVLGHVPPQKHFRPYSRNIFFLMRPCLINEQKFIEIMKRYNVNLYICGHRHFGSTLMDGDLRIVISGGGGQGPGVGGTVNTPLFTPKKHFLVIDINHKNLTYSGYMSKIGENPNLIDPKLSFQGFFTDYPTN
jgi:predicted phosphodiesterase